MSENPEERSHVLEVRRALEELGLGDPEQLYGWDGSNVEDLRDLLTEEEFQALMDHLEQADEGLTAP